MVNTQKSIFSPSYILKMPKLKIKNLCGINALYIVFILPFLLFSFKPLNRTGYRIRTVVIDAGHGGHDTGCLGSSSKEKVIALNVALRLGKMISERYPDIKVVYTRKTDVFVELHERANIANKHESDLFICIHCNSGNKAAYGVETFVMGLHKTDDNLSVSKRENASVLLEKDYKTKYDGYDPNSPESHIIFNLYQNVYMEKSLTFASKVQANFEEYANRYNRGVKQAGFLVLYKTAMPSVLIETGFLTNANDEKYLLSDKGQEQTATAIYNAFKEYKVDMEEGDAQPGSTQTKSSEATNTTVIEANQNEVKATTSNKNTDTVKVGASDTNAKPKNSAIEPVANTKPATNSNSKTTDTGIIASAKKADSLAHAKTHKQPVVKTQEKSEARTDIKAPPKSPEGIDEALFYTIQIGATPILTEDEKLKYANSGARIITSEDGKMLRITMGHYKTLHQAQQQQKILKTKGYNDAFITPYHQGKRITLKQAADIK